MALIYGEMQWKNKAAAQAAAPPSPAPAASPWVGGGAPSRRHGGGGGGGWPVLGQGRKCVKFYKMMNVTQSCQPIQTTPVKAALGTKTPHWEIEFPHFSENVTHLHLHSPSESLTQSEVRW